MSGLFTVLARELRRTGRQNRTWTLRFFAGAFPFSVALVTWSVLWFDPPEGGQLAGIGYALFVAWWVLLGLLSGLLTPLLVADALIEERDDGTLELLAATALTASQIVWGKVLSRLLLLGTYLLSTLPVLAVLSSMGGFGPSEVLQAGAFALHVTLFSAGITAVTALPARSPLAPALWTWTALFSAFVIGTFAVAVRFAVYGAPTPHVAFAPLPGFLPPWTEAAVAALGWAPLALALLFAGDRGFRLTSADGVFARSTDQRDLDGLAWVSAGGLLFSGFGLPAGLYLSIAHRDRIPGIARLDATGLLGTVQASVVNLAAIGTFSAAWLLLTLLFFQVQRDAPRWAAARKRAARRTVGLLPVLWRALNTGAHGPGWKAAWGIALAYAAFILWSWDGRLGSVGVEDALLTQLFTLIFATMIITMSATAAVLDERARGTLPLLLLTTLPRSRIIAEKVLFSMVRVAPLLGVGLAFVLLAELNLSASVAAWRLNLTVSSPVDASGLESFLWHDEFVMNNAARLQSYEDALAWRLPPRAVGALTLSIGGWTAAWCVAWAGLITTASLLVRPARLAWPIAATLWLTMWFGPFFLIPFEEYLPVEALADLWMPGIATHGEAHGVPILVALATLGWGLLAAGFAATATLALTWRTDGD